MRIVAIGCLCAGALAAVGCSDGAVGPTSPSATAAVSGLAASAPGNDASASQSVDQSLSASPRSGALQVTKECSEYTGLAGDFCTITSSNVKAIEVGSRVVYAQAAGMTTLDTDVVLDAPGRDNNQAFGHCALDLATGLGLCTFSGGTGKFTWFSATAHVSPPTAEDPDNWHWDGTYSFMPHD